MACDMSATWSWPRWPTGLLDNADWLSGLTIAGRKFLYVHGLLLLSGSQKTFERPGSIVSAFIRHAPVGEEFDIDAARRVLNW